MSAPPEQGEASRPLARNTACHQCRKRKLKCDAIRPCCNNCSRPRQRGQEKDGDNEPCSWDEPREPSARTRRKRAAAARRVAATVETASEDSDDDSPGSVDRSKRERLNRVEARLTQIQDAFHLSDAIPTVPPPHMPGPNDAMTMPFSQSTPDMMNWLNSMSLPGISEPSATAAPDPPIDLDFSSLGLDAFSRELIWPDWPTDLPSIAVVERVIEVFFDRVPHVPKMIHRASLTANLQLPPSHSSFPFVGLLHAILAITSPYLPTSFAAHRSCYPVGTPISESQHPVHDFVRAPQTGRAMFATYRMEPEETSSPAERFQMWHRRKAFNSMGTCVAIGGNLMQALQAVIIATYVDMVNAWWVDLWAEAGSCIRMAIPFKLHETPNIPSDSLRMMAQTLLPPSSTPLEQAERDRTFWIAYCLERMVTASTTYSTAIHDSDITIELPVSQAMFDLGVGNLTGIQTLQSPDLLSRHPPEHVDSLSLLIKGFHVYAEVLEFLRVYMRGSHNYQRYTTHPALRQVLAKIHAFRLSFPAHLRRPVQRLPDGRETIDGDLCLALNLTHCATITLGDPMVDNKVWSNDAARMSITAVRAILSLLYDVTSTSYDLSLLPAGIAYTWMLSAKSLIRFVRAAQVQNDPVAASVFESELNVFKGALNQYAERHPIAARQLKMIESMQALPLESLMPFECSLEQVLDPDYLPPMGSSKATTPAGSGAGSASTPSLYQTRSGQTSSGSTGLTPMWDAVATPLQPDGWQQSRTDTGAGAGAGAGLGDFGGPAPGIVPDPFDTPDPASWMAALNESLGISSLSYDLGMYEKPLGEPSGVV